MINCEYYPDCSICEYRDYCYFRDDSVAERIDTFSMLLDELEFLFEIHNNKLNETHYILESVDDINFRIDVVFEDMLNIKKNG